MKKLLLILLLIPTVLVAQTKEEKKAKEQAKKEAIKNLKTVLKKYPHWKWNGNIHKDNIDQTTSIDLSTGDYFSLDLTFISTKDLGKNLGTMLSFTLPSDWLPNWDGLPDGSKTLKIQARFDGGTQFETKLYSDNNPNIWLFKPGKVKNKNGETVNPMKDLFFNNTLYIQFQTSEFSRQNGSYHTVEFDLSGAKEAYDAAKQILIN